MRKNILVLISENYNNSDFREWVEKMFSSENIDIYVVDNAMSRVDLKLSTADYVLNFIDSKENFEYVQKKIELLKIPFFGNTLLDIKLFLEKSNFKKIIEKSKFKTPVFEKISSRTPVELFNNFIHPSRIFSKKDSFFSEKNKSLIDLENIFSSVGDNIEEYFIEEFIEGDDVYVLSIPERNGQNNIFSVVSSNGIIKKLNFEIEDEIKSDINSFIKYSGIKGFILFNLIYSKKRGVYFLNIFLKNSILFEHYDILEKIINTHDYIPLKDILKKDLF